MEHSAYENIIVGEREILVTPEGSNAPEQVIAQELGALIGEPDRRQKELLEDLERLHHSLHGPEDLLDRGNYSRPFPPRTSSRR
jgi:hypothetical protein